MAVQDEVMKVIKIIPPAKVLQIVPLKNQQELFCPVSGCAHVAENASMLGLHKAKVHNVKLVAEKGMLHQYHCPEAGCVYNPESLRFFKSMDKLRTHYMKLHSDKKFSCSKCRKQFGLERDCLRHEKECGDTFTCPDCGKEYNQRYSLLMHCNVKGHKKPDQLLKSKPEKTSKNNKTKKDKDEQQGVKKTKQSPKQESQPKPKPAKVQTDKHKPVFILPKQDHAPVVISAAFQPSINCSATKSTQMQTDHISDHFVLKWPSAQAITQGVQTVQTRLSKKSAGIQTSKVFLPSSQKSTKKQKSSTGIQTIQTKLNKSKKSLSIAQTQTKSSILQTAMDVANIPTEKVSQGTQKSHKRKRRTTNSQAQTGGNYSAVGKRRCLISSMIQTQDSFVPRGVLDQLPSMSTQTQLSGSSEQMSLFSHPDYLLLQDTHTQTSSHHLSACDPCMQAAPANTSQITQTTLEDLFSNQDTQTQGIQNIFDDNSTQFQTIETQTMSGQFHFDSHTQTYDLLGSDGNHQNVGCQMDSGVQFDSHTQTSANGLESGYHTDIETQTLQSSLGLDFEPLLAHMETQTQLTFLSSQSSSLLNQPSTNFGGESSQVAGYQDVNSEESALDSQNDNLPDVLNEVMNGSFPGESSMNNFNVISNPQIKCPSKLTNNGLDVRASTDNLKTQATDTNSGACFPAVHHHLQLQHHQQQQQHPHQQQQQQHQNVGVGTDLSDFGSLLNADGMTQTVDDLGWDMGTQTMEDLVTDMMTQTGDELLEFLTSDSHTQTLLDSGQATSDSSTNTMDDMAALTTDIATQYETRNIDGVTALTSEIATQYEDRSMDDMAALTSDMSTQYEDRSLSGLGMTSDIATQFEGNVLSNLASLTSDIATQYEGEGLKTKTTSEIATQFEGNGMRNLVDSGTGTQYNYEEDCHRTDAGLNTDMAAQFEGNTLCSNFQNRDTTVRAVTLGTETVANYGTDFLSDDVLASTNTAHDSQNSQRYVTKDAAIQSESASSKVLLDSSMQCYDSSINMDQGTHTASTQSHAHSQSHTHISYSENDHASTQTMLDYASEGSVLDISESSFSTSTFVAPKSGISRSSSSGGNNSLSYQPGSSSTLSDSLCAGSPSSPSANAYLCDVKRQQQKMLNSVETYSQTCPTHYLQNVTTPAASESHTRTLSCDFSGPSRGTSSCQTSLDDNSMSFASSCEGVKGSGRNVDDSCCQTPWGGSALSEKNYLAGHSQSSAPLFHDVGVGGTGPTSSILHKEWSRETAGCQTSWTDCVLSVGSTQTQTSQHRSSSSSVGCGEGPEMCNAETATETLSALMRDGIDSFTQTNLDQNTQTQPLDVDSLLDLKLVF